MRSLWRRHSFGGALWLLACALCAIVSVYALLKPRVHPVAVVRAEKITHIDSWADTSFPQPHSDLDVLFHVWSPLPFGKLQLYVDDCVFRVVVNGRGVKDDRFPYCNWRDYLTVDVSGFTRVGSNTVTVVVHNDRGSGGLRAVASQASWLYRAMLTSVLASVAAFGVWWFLRAKTAAARVTASWVTVGSLLRVFYAAFTEYNTRAYDWDGHLEYIHYIADNWVLPVGSQGWEFHQQPLYYLFGGIVLSITRFFNAEDSFIDIMHFASLLMSLGTLFAVAKISTLLFPERDKHSSIGRFAFLGLFATLPGIVMLTSRVNNDVPTLLFASLSLAFLFSWWKHGSFDAWAGAAGFVTLALLSKSSALPLLVVFALAWLMRKQSVRARFATASTLGVLLLVTVGGMFVLRVIIQGQDELVPVWVTAGLRVKNFPAAFYTFNPWQILMHPFNHNWIDEERRQYMWEYCFRSAFFGEWEFRSLFDVGSTVTLSSALLLIPCFLWGVARSAWKPGKVPSMLLALLVSSFVALACFRYMHPNSSNQELRYVSFVVIPIGYFLARGMASMRHPLPFAAVASVMFAASSAFLVLVAMHSQ